MRATLADGIGNQHEVEAIEARGTATLPASTYELIRRGARLDPAAPAVSFFATVDHHQQPQRTSYRQLLGRITQTANLFHRLGATKDTVIAVVLPNLPETHFAVWGAEAAGVVLPLNPLLEAEPLAALLEAAGAEIVVTLGPQQGSDLWERISPALQRQRALRHVALVATGALDPPAPVAAHARTLPQVGAGVAVHAFDAIALENASTLDSGRVFSPDDASSWFATGGTTGLPKLAIRTHGNEVANAWAVSQALGNAVRQGTTLLCGLPLFHVNGVMVTGLLPFSTGAHVLLATPQGYRAPGLVARFWEIVEHHRVNFFSAVPTLYASLLEVPLEGRDVSCLHDALCGAAPMPTEVFKAFEARTGIRILEGYGLTEAGCVSSLNPIHGERRIGSIGLRLPGQAMKCVVLDERGKFVRDCAAGEVGTLTVSGPNVFRGYRNPVQNQGVWIDRGDAQRWLDTGDLGRCDPEGYFWLTGRRKDLIIRGGHNIDPAVIEEPLHRHPAVELAAAVGRPDAHSGEVPVAYVKVRAGASVSEAELQTWLAGAVGERAALPKRVHLIDQMPLTPVGKIFKPELKRREAREALASALHEAGLEVQEITMVQHPSLGMQAQVVLRPGASSQAARVVLGRFAVPVTLA